MTLHAHKILTLAVLQSFKPATILDTGHFEGGPDGLNVYQRPGIVRWTAVKGHVDDWAVYVGPEKYDPWMAARSGDKVYDIDKIKLIVPCDDAAAERYRG